MHAPNRLCLYRREVLAGVPQRTLRVLHVAANVRLKSTIRTSLRVREALRSRREIDGRIVSMCCIFRTPSEKSNLQ